MVTADFSWSCPPALTKGFEGSVQLRLKSVDAVLEPQGGATRGGSEPRAAMTVVQGVGSVP